jgi:hypothetical protein
MAEVQSSEGILGARKSIGLRQQSDQNPRSKTLSTAKRDQQVHPLVNGEWAGILTRAQRTPATPNMAGDKVQSSMCVVCFWDKQHSRTGYPVVQG